MQQYFEIKKKHPDALLLFRVGDFYETFGEDAVKASQILGIVLTSRNVAWDLSEIEEWIKARRAMAIKAARPGFFGS